MKKKIVLRITLTSLLAFALLLALLFLFWLGPMAKTIVEQVGLKALGTPVTIEHLSINPRKGTLELRGFQIGIHEGFNRSSTFRLAEFSIAMDVRSLFSDRIIIHEIKIDHPHFIYEQNKSTDNISQFILNIQAFAGIDPDQPKKKKKKKKKDPSKESKKVIIEQLTVHDLQIHAANTDDPQLDIQLGMEEFSLCLTNGVIQLQHLSLSVPGQLSSPNALEIESIGIQMDPDSIYSGPIQIEEILVIKPYAFLEKTSETDTVSEFMKFAQSFIDRLDESPEPAPSEAPAPAAIDAPKKAPFYELHNLFVDDIQLKLLDSTRPHAEAEARSMASIQSLSVQLLEGRIQIEEVTLPNPEADFTTTNLFHLARIGITMDPESIHSDQLVIQEVFLDSPKINLEQTETTGNIAELQAIVRSFIPPAGPATAEPTPEEATKEATKEPTPLSEKPVVLDALVVTNFTVHMITPGVTNAPEEESLLAKASLKKLRPKNWFDDGPTNTPVTLIAFEQFLLEPNKGLLQIDQLQIGNPKGFANDTLVTLQHFRMDLDFNSIQGDTLIIEDILVDRPRISYERKLSTDNIKALQASIGTVFSKRTQIMEEVESTAPAESSSERKIIIEHLLVQNGRINAKVSALPAAPIPLPNIERNNMGKEEGGISITDTMSTLTTLFYDSIIGAVSGLTGFASDALKGVGSFTRDTVEKMTGDEDK